MLFLLAVVLPGLFWQGGPETVPSLRQAGITQILVPASQVESWKSVSGIQARAVDLQGAEKLPSPGVSFRMERSSASRVPWITSNGSRFIRRPDGRFYYDVKGSDASLAAAEAFCFAGNAIVKTDESGLGPMAEMIKFLGAFGSPEGQPLADIGVIDDGTPAAGEVMNLLVRYNLLFKVVTSAEPDVKLTVKLGSREYPAQEEKNPVALAQKIRANLTDDRRTLRIYGTSVVVARITKEPGGLRLHLLNYGAAKGTRVGAFRVRVLGRYSKAQFHSFGSLDDQLKDYDLEPGATEFTVPELKAYAVVDLSQN